MGVVHPRSEPAPHHQSSVICRCTDANHLDYSLGAPFDPVVIAGRPIHVGHVWLGAGALLLSSPRVVVRARVAQEQTRASAATACIHLNPSCCCSLPVSIPSCSTRSLVSRKQGETTTAIDEKFACLEQVIVVKIILNHPGTLGLWLGTVTIAIEVSKILLTKFRFPLSKPVGKSVKFAI